jgi:hypothetical protein
MESLQSFVWEHMEEYRFAACDEWWLKTMLNPKIGVAHACDRKHARKEAA